MTANKQYITQLTGEDLREIANVANAKAGEGIELVPDPAGLVVRIDKEQLKRWMWTFWKNGGFADSVNVAEKSMDRLEAT